MRHTQPFVHELESFDHYRIVRRLGAGGMGEVYLGHDESLDRPVAIKRLHGDHALSGELRERFHREAKVAARLNHPAIVHVYDLVHGNDADCIVMEYVEGENLRQYLDSHHPSMAEVIRIAQQVAAGMAEAHDRDIVHRDLKSENILIASDGRVKITDFGIAKVLGSDTLTADGAVLGTYRAMSPEQAAGKPVDQRSDLFSFGVLLYEALSGVTPFAADNPLVMVEQIVNEDPVAIEQRVAGVPDVLARLVEQLLRKMPALRPRNFREVAGVLAELGEQLEAGIDVPVAATSGCAAGADTVGVDRKAQQSADKADRIDPAAPPRGTDQPPRTRSLRAAIAPRQHKTRPVGMAATMLVAVVVGTAGISQWSGWSQQAHNVESPSGAEPASSDIEPAASDIEPAAITVAVLEPDIKSDADNPRVELAAMTLRNAVVRGLHNVKGVVVASNDDVDRVNAPSVLRADLARALSADELVASSLHCAKTTCRVELRWVLANGHMRDIVDFPIDLADFRNSCATIAHWVQARYPERQSRADTSIWKISKEDYVRFLKLRREAPRQGANREQILAELAAIRENSPGFLEVILFEANILRRRFHSSREPRDIDRALDLVESARAHAPDAITPLIGLFEIAFAKRDAETAQRALDALVLREPGNPWTFVYRSQLAELRGNLDEALGHMRQAADRHPSWRILYNLSIQEFSLGHTQSARRNMERVLELSPDDYDAQSQLAQFELVAGDATRAMSLNQALVRRSPDFQRYTNLGDAQLLAGRYAAALATYQQALELAPKNPLASFNIAFARLLMGDHPLAAQSFQRFVDRIRRKPDPDPYDLALRAVALANLQRTSEAVRDIQSALRRAPEDIYVIYFAAMAYAMLGEVLSTKVNATKACERGFAPHWFSFPWFDNLRRDAEFQKVLLQTPVSRAN
ncbi:MAG: protein kinase [Proteobacteria bacterium]|nr:protein kinase [Pseudomonadota bacterium]